MKSGFVAILGRPNVGKSTILNAILNKKISIVTDKSQTTRDAIKGIYNADGVQIVFTDTPGIHKPHAKLGEEMNNTAFSAAHDVDASILVVDASMPFGEFDQYIIDHLDIKNVPLIIALNKIDQARINEVMVVKEKYQSIFPEAHFVEMVAKDRFNIDELLKVTIDLLPEGPAYYPDDVLSDKNMSFIAKEIIREKALKTLKQEVPHSIAVVIDKFDEKTKPVHISASIIVEKDSQKGIVIGKGGERLKKIGQRSREDIERILSEHVFLELFVRVQEDWRNTDALLESYGYKQKKK